MVDDLVITLHNELILLLTIKIKRYAHFANDTHSYLGDYFLVWIFFTKDSMEGRHLPHFDEKPKSF